MKRQNCRSVATIDAPEFIKIEKMNNPLISKCEIKVLYLGDNRNRTRISKEVAIQMAQTLPGCPIVGHYVESKEDFGDHGNQIIIDNEGVKFSKSTKPYGFVAPDAKIWFKNFEDTTDDGVSVVRTYLMTEGYLWTGQYEEVKQALGGNPQSMELDEKTFKGYWSKEESKGFDIFIINDAIFSKLCILGEDVEPCFEGAKISTPDISLTFSKNDDFSKSLFNMMAELQYTLQEGGIHVEKDILDNPIVTDGSEPIVNEPINDNEPIGNEEPIVESVEPIESSEPSVPVENFSNLEDKVGENIINENDNSTGEYVKAEEEDDDKKDETSKPTPEDKGEEDEDKKKYSLLQEEYSTLETELSTLRNDYSLLEEKYKELVDFKLKIEDEKKDELIKSFYMLSDEDKTDVIMNKSNYSLDDIKAKLSIICVEKKVNFNLTDSASENEDSGLGKGPTIFNLDSKEQSSLPAWLKVVDDVKNRNIL